MASLCILLGTLLFIQGVWSIPAKTDGSADNKPSKETGEANTNVAITVSAGTQLSDNLNENTKKILDNLRIGAAGIATPVVKFGVNTVPNLFSSSFKTAAGTASKIVDAKKKGFGKIINGVASAASGGAVLASSIVGGNMKIIGSGLGVAGNLLDAVAKFGLNITDNLVDSAVLGNVIMADLTNSILEGMGKGMSVAGDGVNIISQSSSKVIDAIGDTISKSIGNFQDTMAMWFKNRSAKFQDGAMILTTAAQVDYYNAFQWYLHNLMAMESIMDKLTETINSSGGTKSSTSEKADEKGESTNKNDKEDKV